MLRGLSRAQVILDKVISRLACYSGNGLVLARLVLSHCYLLQKVSKFKLGFCVRHFSRSLIHVNSRHVS